MRTYMYKCFVPCRICELLEGRGGGKTRFSGKVTRLGKRKEAEKYVMSVLEGSTPEANTAGKGCTNGMQG